MNRYQAALPILLALIVGGCADMTRQEINVTDRRVTKIVLTDVNEVDGVCTNPTTDHGKPRPHGPDATHGGCYQPPNGPIYINQAYNVAVVLRHELCHALSGLSPAECDDLYPMPHFERGYIDPKRMGR